MQIAALYPMGRQTIAFGDTDHDGSYEAAFRWRDSNWEWHYAILEEQGGNVYTQEYAGADLLPYGIADMDGDGQADLVGQYGSYVQVYESIDATSYPTELVWISPALSNIEGFTKIGDTDRDGRREIIHSANSGRLYIFENSGNNSYTQVFTTVTGFQDDGEKAIADFDGDGLLEIAFCGSDGWLHVYESPTDNTWVETFSDSTGLLNAYGTEGGVDADGNGIPELFIAGDKFPGYQKTTLVYEAGNDNQFARVATLLTSDSGAGGANNALGELDGTGQFEYVTQGYNRLWFYRATAPGQWAVSSQLQDPTGPLLYIGVQIFDVNGNGKGELFWDSFVYPILVFEHPPRTSDTGPVDSARMAPLRLVPNPCRGRATIVVPSSTLGAEWLSVYDVAGRLVQRLRLPGGQASHLWDADRLGAGVYYIQFEDRRGAPLARGLGTIVR